MSRNVTVEFTPAQANEVHAVLALVLNDPDWYEVFNMGVLARADDRIMAATARETSNP